MSHTANSLLSSSLATDALALVPDASLADDFVDFDSIPRYIAKLEQQLGQITAGFKIQQTLATTDFTRTVALQDREVVPAYCHQLALEAFGSKFYQVRMYGVFLLGYMSQDSRVLSFLREQVALDDNWRVQEVLAKAFDHHCKLVGYEQALPTIDQWLASPLANTRRAVTEGLRHWHSRPYFKQHPEQAISRLAALRYDQSEYVRKSVGNALRDISRKHPELIRAELATWDLSTKPVQQVHKLASKFLAD